MHCVLACHDGDDCGFADFLLPIDGTKIRYGTGSQYALIYHAEPLLCDVLSEPT